MTTAAEPKGETETPAPRRRGFSFASVADRWIPDDPFRARFFDAFSTMLPIGEQFFVESVRRREHEITDPILGREIRRFAGEEKSHAVMHGRYNEQLARQGFDVERMAEEQRSIMWGRLLSGQDPGLALAVTVAAEHITAVVGARLLGEHWLAGADPEMQRFWRWHAREELEHKSVAFDVYRAVGGTLAMRRRVMATSAILLALRLGGRTLRMLRHDGDLLRPQVWSAAAPFVFGRHGLVGMVPEILAFFREDFHPSQRDAHASAPAHAHASAPAGSPATPRRTGRIFDILREHGEDTTGTAVLWDTDTRTVVARRDADHAQYDGYSGTVTFFEQNRIACTPPAFPRSQRAPSLMKRCVTLARAIRSPVSTAKVSWRIGAPFPAGRAVTHRAAAACVLSHASTQHVKNAAKVAHVSLNSYLLHALHTAVAPEVATAPYEGSWGMPVTMRASVRVEPEHANAASIVAIPVHDGDAVTEVHETIQHALARGLHWGNWDRLNLTVRFGDRALRKKIDDYYRGEARLSRFGVFSNLGAWSGDTSSSLAYVLLGVPTRSDPIFGIAVTWNGRLALSLRVHPSVTDSDEIVARWLHRWVERAAPGAESFMCPALDAPSVGDVPAAGIDRGEGWR